LIARSEVGVAAFAGEYLMRRAVPIHSGLAQAGAGGDDGLIADVGCL
jgi:hypothetical protein